MYQDFYPMTIPRVAPYRILVKYPSFISGPIMRFMVRVPAVGDEF